ncbi:tRNA pseudouridine(38-40) synthase TruA [Corynebacterium liangguodongii]|uniref:tRNA pseudouridine synthase A n=1 Tax=Corynebacterium liangguodongii TaxID=2079535 RepID=A0A2S0WCB1_9CORY|nr:tRNA pseudouridine(38-40) synthase TruA [Corynebacterium liangguodongii]AWB83403.1 tRNA pseudouridine(38-40) synthase TruA [Corynebacterium liangguodongii]PWC00507.1 tRNA pseudouridine(38-40) synthase TruA [Corynebacterium liangguodongii]
MHPAQTDKTIRLRLDIAYDGTDFHGWARQADQADGTPTRTVQATLEDALTTVLRTPSELTVAGRTDAGVHASGQVAHLDVPAAALEQRSIDGDPARLVRRLAKLLPADVRVRAVREVSPLFDARFSALTRSYVYRVTTHPAGPLPTRARDTAVWGKPVDIERAQAAADLVAGLHDFAAFCKAKPHATTVREVVSMRWVEASTREEPKVYEAHVEADAFCWNMVRALVATCLKVGEGAREAEWVSELLGQRRRNPQVGLAPAHGLTLVRVAYPPPEDYGRRAQATRARRE